MDQIIKLKNGNELEFYDYYLTDSSCQFRFFNVSHEDVLKFFGTGIIEQVELINNETNTYNIIPLNMKYKALQAEYGTIKIKHLEVVKEGCLEELPIIDTITGKQIYDDFGNPLKQVTAHPAEINTTETEEQGLIITLTLEKVTLSERIDLIEKDHTRYDLSYNVCSVLAQNLDDATALSYKEIYPEYTKLTDENFVAEKAGYKCLCNGELYKTIKDNVEFISSNSDISIQSTSILDNNPNFKKIENTKAVV